MAQVTFIEALIKRKERDATALQQKGNDFFILHSSPFFHILGFSYSLNALAQPTLSNMLPCGEKMLRRRQREQPRTRTYETGGARRR